MTRTRPWVLVLALGLGCNANESAPHKVEPIKAKQPPPAMPPAQEPESLAASRDPVHGPASEASSAERRAAVLTLLTDGTTAEHLPVVIRDLEEHTR